MTRALVVGEWIEHRKLSSKLPTLFVQTANSFYDFSFGNDHFKILLASHLVHILRLISKVEVTTQQISVFQKYFQESSGVLRTTH